jgi:hypothetical protein
MKTETVDVHQWLTFPQLVHLDRIDPSITGIAGCSARAASGHAVAPAITDKKSRVLIAAPKA